MSCRPITVLVQFDLFYRDLADYYDQSELEQLTKAQAEHTVREFLFNQGAAGLPATEEVPEEEWDLRVAAAQLARKFWPNLGA